MNLEAYHGKSVTVLIFMLNHSFRPEDKKKINQMIVGQIRATIVASFTDLLIVKASGTTFYLNFITGAPKMHSFDLTAKDNKDSSTKTTTKSDSSNGHDDVHNETKEDEDMEEEDNLGDRLEDLRIKTKDDSYDTDSNFEDAYNVGLTQELDF
jgi:hypothetical protein